MLRSDRLGTAARDRGKSLTGAAAGHLTSAIRGRRKSLMYVGTALALAGAGSASAATIGASKPAVPLAARAISSARRRRSAARPRSPRASQHAALAPGCRRRALGAAGTDVEAGKG